MTNLLEASHLTVSCPTQSGVLEIIHDVSFEVRHEETVVILGESGSGKTVLSRALTGLFPDNVPMNIEGTMSFDGNSVSFADREQIDQLRRSCIRYIFQEPQQALNPVARIRAQLKVASNGMSLDDHALEEVLATVGLVDHSTRRENGREVLDLYPHQLSVGMAQRVTIAMAILPSPQLLIADEPTSALDASLRFKLLDLLRSLQQSRRMSMILITHDLDVARAYGDRIIVLYNGRIIESAGRDEFFSRPLHPYSRLLMEAQLQVGKRIGIGTGTSGRFNDEQAASGCRFHPRCPKVQPDCTESEPPLERIEQEREVRCLYWK